MTRKNFIIGMAALAGSSKLPSFAGNDKSNLRIGILSDIHVTAMDNSNWFEKALRHFDSIKVDGVLITGDLTTYNKLKEFEAVAATWFKVFPNDLRSDGAHIERLFLTGNHDVDGWSYGGARYKTAEEAKPESFFFNREEFWQRLFHERYEPIMVKELKGYTFILRNWMSILGTESKGHGIAAGFQDEISPLPEVLARLGDKLRGKPFFYAQHDQIADTVNSTWLLRGESWSNGQDNGFARKHLKAYPNCVALTGHSHYSLTDEQSIWQGEFTSVNCSCARGFAFTNPGRENGFACTDFNRKPPFEMERFDHKSVRQGLVMDVFDDRINLQRLDITYDQSLGEDWVIPIYANGSTIPANGTPKYDIKTRAAAAKPPTFAPGDKVTVAKIEKGYRRDSEGIGALDKSDPHAQLVVTFPPITTATSPSRGFDFKVTCEMKVADMVQTVQERRVFSPNAYQAESRDVVPCTCHFPVRELPERHKLRFVVTPYDCWGNAGRPIASDWN